MKGSKQKGGEYLVRSCKCGGVVPGSNAAEGHAGAARLGGGNAERLKKEMLERYCGRLPGAVLHCSSMLSEHLKTEWNLCIACCHIPSLLHTVQCLWSSREWGWHLVWNDY